MHDQKIHDQLKVIFLGAIVRRSGCKSSCCSSSCERHVFYWATACKTFALCYRAVVCPVSLSVTLVYCGQTVGWIKMKLGTVVGLGPGHILLDGDSAPPQ